MTSAKPVALRPTRRTLSSTISIFFKRVLHSLSLVFSAVSIKCAVNPLKPSLLFEMSSQALRIGDNPTSPSFVQHGQVDWVAFANTTVSASVSVMQRFSAAGVQPVTLQEDWL